MSDWSQQKKHWVDDLQQNIIPAYETLVTSGQLHLKCTNRPDTIIVFPKWKFPHLVGLSYYSSSDRKNRRKISDREFYDLLKNGEADSKKMDYTHADNGRGTNVHTRHDHTERKMSIALQAFTDLANMPILASWIVDSAIMDTANNPIVIFTGTSTWALGLARQKTSDGTFTGVYIPRSLVKSDVQSDRNMRKGSTASPIISATWK